MPEPVTLADLDAFLGEHRRCGDLAGGVTDIEDGSAVVWMTCSCGAALRRLDGPFEAAA